MIEAASPKCKPEAAARAAVAAVRVGHPKAEHFRRVEDLLRDAIAKNPTATNLLVSMADLRGSARGLLLEWVPFMAILIAYDSLRGSAGHLFAVHYLPQLDVDRWLFGGTTPTVALQHWLWHGHVVWYDVVAWCVYLTHFFATPIVAAVLWKVNRPRFRVFAVLVATLRKPAG